MKIELQGRTAYAYTGGRPFDAAKPCVILIHGALHDHSVWGLQSRYLAHHGWSVLAVDLPGHGRSAGPALPDVEALGRWVAELVDAVGAPRAALVGHSMGSLIALEAAACLRERATHLALVATAYPMRVSASLLETAARDPLRAIDMVNAFSHSTLAAKPSAPGPGSWLHGTNRALMRRLQDGYALQRDGANLFLHDFRLCDAYSNAWQAAEQVRCPVQLVLGRKDQMTSPKATAELAQRLGAGVVVIDAGHTLMTEAPDAVLNALKAFLLSSRTPS